MLRTSILLILFSFEGSLRNSTGALFSSPPMGEMARSAREGHYQPSAMAARSVLPLQFGEGEEEFYEKGVSMPSDEFPRLLRRKQTDAERKLWFHLRIREALSEDQR
jgi:hypothetical protein